MTQTSISNHIARASLFQGLDADQIDRIARRTERVLFQAGDNITIQGEVGDKAILIVEGEIDCVAGVGTDMDFEGDQGGAMLGEMAMFIDDFEHPATFKARNQTKALLIDRREMLQELADDPDDLGIASPARGNNFFLYGDPFLESSRAPIKPVHGL